MLIAADFAASEKTAENRVLAAGPPIIAEAIIESTGS
jgi:hypothetical protein